MFSSIFRSSRVIRGALCVPTLSKVIVNAAVVNQSFSTSRLLLVAKSTAVRTKTKTKTETKTKKVTKAKAKPARKPSKSKKTVTTSKATLLAKEKEKRAKARAAAKEKLAAKKEWQKERLFVIKDGKKKYFDLKRDELPPKEAPRAYSFFVTENFGEFHKASQDGNGRKAVTDVFRVLASRWNSLSEAEKQVYVDKQQAAVANYEQRRKEFEQKMGPLKIRLLNRYLSDKGKSHFVLSRELRRPVSGFLRYAMKIRAERDHIPMAEATRIASEQWRAMGPQEKEVYNAQAAEETSEWRKKFNV